MEYNPIHLALLAAWIYSGFYTLSFIDRHSSREGNSRALLNLLGLLAGPVVLAFFYLRYGLRRGIRFFTELFGRESAGPRQDIPIELLDSRGQPALAGGSMHNESGEAVYYAKKVIFDALLKRASDIFFDPKSNGKLVVRFRVDGMLKTVDELDLALGASVVSAIKVAAGMDISEKRRPQDGGFSCRSSRGDASFRVASVGVFGGEKITVRVLSAAGGQMTLKDLGLTGQQLKTMLNAVRMPSGMILLCGPTGSGKTSTMYALLQEIDYSLKNVISIEDPIERVIPNIGQMEVNTRAEITFAKLLRNALRQNPDVICLGEIRDEETAQVSSHAAQTGHLIIATVHSNDNLGAIDRLLNLGVPLRTAAAILQVIISQRLVRRLCRCKRPVELTEARKQEFKDKDIAVKTVYEPGGCRECDGSGYIGRVALFDILTVNGKLRSTLEREGASLSLIKEEIEKEHGSAFLEYEGLKLAAAGVTSLAEVERVTLNLE